MNIASGIYMGNQIRQPAIGAVVSAGNGTTMLDFSPLNATPVANEKMTYGQNGDLIFEFGNGGIKYGTAINKSNRGITYQYIDWGTWANATTQATYINSSYNSVDLPSNHGYFILPNHTSGTFPTTGVATYRLDYYGEAFAATSDPYPAGYLYTVLGTGLLEANFANNQLNGTIKLAKYDANGGGYWTDITYSTNLNSNNSYEQSLKSANSTEIFEGNLKGNFAGLNTPYPSEVSQSLVFQDTNGRNFMVIGMGQELGLSANYFGRMTSSELSTTPVNYATTGTVVPTENNQLTIYNAYDGSATAVSFSNNINISSNIQNTDGLATYNYLSWGV